MAWKRLQDIERAGGLSSALRDGLIDEWIENSFLEQRERVTRGAKPVVGVNAFPTTQTERVAIPEIDLGSEKFPLRRDAEIFERLRDAVDILAIHQQRPSLFLSRIGTQNDSDQHVPAVRDAMKLVGVDVIAGNGVSDIEAAAKEFAASGLRCVCMCANVDFYREHAVDLGRALFAAGARCVIFAGSPDYLEVQLLAIGVRSFLYSTCDRLAAYQDILRAYDAELELEGDSE
jgi:methylmalonyl-CoA mutase